METDVKYWWGMNISPVSKVMIAGSFRWNIISTQFSLWNNSSDDFNQPIEIILASLCSIYLKHTCSYWLRPALLAKVAISLICLHPVFSYSVMDEYQIEQSANAFATGLQAEDQRGGSWWILACLYSPLMWILSWWRLKEDFGNIYPWCSGELRESTNSSEGLHAVVNLLSISFGKQTVALEIGGATQNNTS